MDLGCHFQASEQNGVCTSCFGDVVLQSKFGFHHVPQHLKEADEVRFPSSIPSDENIKTQVQCQFWQLSYRAKAFQLNRGERFGFGHFGFWIVAGIMQLPAIPAKVKF